MIAGTVTAEGSVVLALSPLKYPQLPTEAVPSTLSPSDLQVGTFATYWS